MRGFEYLVYSAISLSLLVVLIALPVAPVFAGEEVTEPTEVAESLIEVEEVQTPPEVEIIEPLEVAVDQNSESNSNTPEVIQDATVLPIDTHVSEEVPSVVGDETVQELVVGEVVSEESSDTSSDTLNEAEIDESALEEEIETASTTYDALPVVETATTTEEIISEEEVAEDILEEDVSVDTEDESMQEEVVEEASDGETVSVNSVTTDENKFTFSKDECTLARDGAFYCAKATPEAAVLNTNRVFSAPDSDGDKEIYVERDGELFAITQNTFDDDAPYFDEISNTMVWHRLIDGRYQIMTYDFDSEEETQITNDRYNNMQPSRFGDAIVWQGWVGDDWEIFLLEGDELTMLTDNTTHDITPSINGNHIVWQSFEGNVWRMKVYDMHTGAIETIEDSDGGSIENLRFVLMYDTKFETGDVETKGYDLKSGEVLTLGVQPVSVPEKLPDPEQTGEERALVSPPLQVKTKTDGALDDTDTDDTPQVPVIGEEEMDIVIPPIDTEQGTTTDEYTLEDDISSSTPDVVDVVITPFVEEIESSTDHINDVIVTPFVEPIIEEELADSSTR